MRRGPARSGWWVVVGGSVLLTVQNGLIMAAFGAYLVAVTADTGWAAGVVALGYAVVQLGNGFIAPLTGWACDRVGTRLVAACGSLLGATGFALAALSADETQFLGAVAVIALGCSASGIMPLTVAAVQALPQRRTLALGLLPSGIALGGLAVPLVALALESFGWRATFVGVAVVIAGVGLVAGSVLPTRAPAPVPARPPAAIPDEPPSCPGRAGPAGADIGADTGADTALGTALRSGTFWLLVAGHGTALVAVSAMNLHLVPLLAHHHALPLAVAGAAVAAMSIAQLLGQVVTGLIGDRVDKRRLAAGCMAVQTAVLLVMASVSDARALVAAAVVHGLAWGLRGPIMTAMRTDYFGLSSFGTIMGWSMGFVSLGLVTGPLLVTALEAGPGGYPAAMQALAAVSAVGLVAFLLLRRPALVPERRPRGAASEAARRRDAGATVPDDRNARNVRKGITMCNDAGDPALQRPGTYVFDGATSRRGYRMNKMFMSLRDTASRATFGADEAGYCDRFGLTPDQRRAVLERDWTAMLELGGSIFYVYKLAMMDGHSMQYLGGVFTGTDEESFTAAMRAGGRRDG
ncbi:MFS transporter [Pseudonocardia endophytica]|uniref:Protocatechuate 4,5-dioxygenase alpha subunit n=1 Tax=Pseudonocardia endophytica TaxID=401976 RepID=A0A4R1HIW5_PSEEN|nr:MFS transporter [Pseudonocardia endophytica]TCK22244.1 protocatechuate 4,5-dioxygenase alpha subunit [Pseudonocardia endophytica]